MTAWPYAIILPLAGGMTCLLAIMMKAVIATEFVPQPTDRDKVTVATYIFDPVIICGGYRGKDRINSPPYRPKIPPRLEPDKTCNFYNERPKHIKIQGWLPNDYLFLFDPERARALDIQRKKETEEEAKDPCPLILKSAPTPSNPASFL